MFKTTGFDRHVDQALRQLRRSGHQIYVAQAGACGGLFQALERLSGASRFFIGGRFCNHELDTADFLGHKPDKFVDANQAEMLAATSYWRGVEYMHRDGCLTPNVIGVGMTAAVETNRYRRGNNEVHICIYTPGRVVNRYLRLTKQIESASLREREALRKKQMIFCDALVLNALLSFVGIPLPSLEEAPIIHTDLAPLDQLKVYVAGDAFPYDIVDWNGPTPLCEQEAANQAHYLPSLHGCEKEVILFPGSFDPLTFAHIGLARWVAKMTNRVVVYAISDSHPDKDPDQEALARRINQFRSFASVILHKDAPLYIDKARRHPGVPMVMGADAAMKLLSPVYYGGSFTAMLEVLEEFERLGTVFYVVGREVKQEGNVFLTLDHLPIPNRFRHLFREVTYREDFSSSQVRAAQDKNKNQNKKGK